jgi:hypothetical protein
LYQSLIAVQDFTKLSLTGVNQQCFCLCIYKIIDGKHVPFYYTFVAKDPEASNDSQFVITCWIKLVSMKAFDGVKELHVWSDGGPKHFKVTPLLILFSVLQQTLKCIVNYHFWASYHGSNVCDAMASQIKRSNTCWSYFKNMQDVFKPSRKGIKN